MLKTGKRIAKQRRFSEEFKRKIVQEYEYGNNSIKSLSLTYKITKQSIYGWVYKYSTYNSAGIQVVEMKDSQEKVIRDLQNKIKELEQAVGQKQIKVDFLEKMIDIAKDELNIDIKKNYETQRSGGSKKTKKR